MNQEAEKKEVAEEHPSVEEKKEVTAEQPSVEERKVPLLTPSEQRVMRMLEETRSKPVPVPENLRETLVKLQSHLEKSNTNPELLETVKQDLAFFDDVVMKRRVSCGVCYKEDKTSWDEKKRRYGDVRSRSSCWGCSARGPGQTPSSWACSWTWAWRGWRA